MSDSNSLAISLFSELLTADQFSEKVPSLGPGGELQVERDGRLLTLSMPNEETPTEEEAEPAVTD